MYTLTYTAIYITIYEIKKFVLPCYVFLMFFFWLKIFYSYPEKTQQKRQRKQYKTKQTKETMYSEQLYTIAILATNKSNRIRIRIRIRIILLNH